MVKKALFLIVGFLVLPSLAAADLSPEASAKGDDFTLSGYTEVGRRSTAEDYEEEDTDEDYRYQNYHLKLEQKVSDRLSYDVSSFVYDKDYKGRDSLDNISRIFKTNWSYYLKKLKEESLELGFRLKYKEKRYKNTPANEYDEIGAMPSLTFKNKDLYRLDLVLGIDNFDYLAEGEKDQLKIFTKIGAGRYFLEKALRLISSYKIEDTEQEKIDRKRTKQEVLAGFDYLFDPAPNWCWVDLPWIYKLAVRAEWGQRDTKEEEEEGERDEDYDYEYWRYYTKTEHKINPKLKTDLRYQYFKKDYVTADLDHRGFYFQNNWDYEIIDDEKQRWDLEFGLEHKDVKYNLKSGNDYQKETAEVKLSYQRKKNYKLQAAIEENFYDFNDSSNDKKRTYIKLSTEKLFFAGDLVLSLDFKYRYTDYEQKDDSSTEAVRVAFKYKF